jgi:hypothetical protein
VIQLEVGKNLTIGIWIWGEAFGESQDKTLETDFQENKGSTASCVDGKGDRR